MRPIISGIQQIGIGVRDVHQAWAWYRHHFGMDIEVFEEKATAELMLPHTNNLPIPRHAVLALNMQGGGGFEIWQQTKYEPKPPGFELGLGDLGIYICKIKCREVDRYYQYCSSENMELMGGIHTDPAGRQTFFVRDPYGNIFQVVESDIWYRKEANLTGGTYGAVIGVSEIDKALPLYQDILGHDTIVYDQTSVFVDLNDLPAGEKEIRRVLLRNSSPRKGAFGKLLSTSEIELVQRQDGTGKKIFKDRIWGDLGYIHLCFDTRRMDQLKRECCDRGFPFTVDSADSFDMGVAAGRFSYVEDPDGTLIEFVETHKVPIVKKLGWYMKLENRDPEKHLPNWMVNTLAWKRKKT